MSFQNPTFFVQLGLLKKKTEAKGRWRQERREERKGGRQRACAGGRLLNTES